MLDYAKCEICALNKASRRVLGSGPLDADIAIVGEAPGLHEERFGKPFVGQAGELLTRTLQAVGIDRNKQCYITNACICRPPKNRTPKVDEIDACNARLQAELEEIKPKVIVALGNSAIRAILNHSHAISKIRGQRFWSKRFNCYVLATYHPAAILRQPQLFDDFCRDIEKIHNTLKLKPGGIPEPRTDYEVMKTIGQALRLIEFLRKQQYVSCDIEASGFDYLTNEILSIGFSWNEGKAAIIPKELLADKLVVINLQALFETPTVRFIFHNGKFDAKFIENQLGIKVRIDEDTLLMHYCIDEREGTHGLKNLAREYLDAPDYTAELERYLSNSKAPYSAIPPEVLYRYQAKDCDYTRRLFFVLKEQLESEQTARPYSEILIPASNAFKDIEQRGVLIDRQYLHQLEAEMKPQLEKLEQELHDLAVDAGLDVSKLDGGRLNARSPQQLQHVLYDLLGLPLLEQQRTTSVTALNKYQDKHVFVKKLLEYRQLSKLYSTYIQGFKERLTANDQIYPEFFLFGTVTGRLSSKDPNIQNIPRNSKIKRMFIASPGYTFVEADYSQLELRVAAHYSQEETLIKAFNEGADIHRQVASKVFRKPPEQITDEQRRIAKSTIFGILYGRSAYSLATGELNCSVEEAQKFIDDFFAGMPKLHKWLQQVQQKALKNGEVVTEFGRKRRFRFIHPSTVNSIRRQAVNAPIQSMASDICLTSVIRLHREFQRTGLGYILFSVHDSIACEVRTDKLNQAVKLIKEVMENPPIKSPVPWKVEIKAGQSWGETKEVEPQ